MTLSKRLLFMAVAVCAVPAWGAPNDRGPHIGYLYPAGGQQGATVEVLAGGQFLKGVENVYVSGDGVTATVVLNGKPFSNKALQELRKQLNELLKERRAGSSGKSPEAAAKSADAPADTMAEPVVLSEHPLLRDIEKMSAGELTDWMARFFSAKKQANAQLGETVLIKVTIAPDAAPGDRELRFGVPAGLTNPLCFQVGLLPEVSEHEPNDRETSATPALDLPVLLNGQIMPGDVDRFRFRARQGQQLVVETRARRLMPYLADAVPGWFQATVALYDARGNEVTFADDYHFDPDPVLFYKVPEDGEYELEIGDAIYRGREDFVYRVALGEQPFITGLFPLGGKMGAKTSAKIAGWNLPEEELLLDTEPGGESVRQATLRANGCLSNSVPYAVDTLRECREHEPNDTVRRAQRIATPRLVNGRIEQPGDLDMFRFKGRAGDTVVAEVCARRLRSPLDSVLRLTDASGRVLEWNDDHEDKAAGLLTHQADSYLCAKLTENGTYYVVLADSQNQGGETFAYRLRVGPPRPDFALRMTPSSISTPVGRAVPVCVHALRKDGFDGDIEVALKDAPAGLKLDGGRIPKGQESVRMTLTAPAEPLEKPFNLQLEGRAKIGEETVTRNVVPAEDMMQAFAYRHLTPSRQLIVAVTGTKARPPLAELAVGTPVRIPAGGTVEVRIKTPKYPKREEVQLALSEPPKGITLQDVTVVPDGLAFTLKMEGDEVQPGYAGNLIVEASMMVTSQQKSGKPAKQNQRFSLGVLPAIPFEIVPK